jgi:transposase
MAQRWNDDGSAASIPRGGSTSPLEKHTNRLLTLIAKQPDLTLDEVLVAMRKRRIAGSRTALWQFFVRHKITFKKVCTRRSRSELTSLEHNSSRLSRNPATSRRRRLDFRIRQRIGGIG